MAKTITELESNDLGIVNPEELTFAYVHFYIMNIILFSHLYRLLELSNSFTYTTQTFITSQNCFIDGAGEDEAARIMGRLKSCDEFTAEETFQLGTSIFAAQS